MTLGITPAPYGHVPGTFPYAINASGVDRTRQLGPIDPQHYTRGEAGYYYDTPLGAPAKMGWAAKRRARKALQGLGRAALGISPTDAELSKVYGYTPTVSSWVNAYSGGQEIFYQPTWNPPSGIRPQGVYQPVFGRTGMIGLGDGEAAPAATVDDVVGVIASHNDRAFALALVSTVAVTTSALISIFRTLRLIRRD